MSELERRIRQVDAFIPESEIRVQELHPDGVRLAGKICEAFRIGYGSLLRRAVAIQKADGESGPLTVDQLREAAQHLVALSEGK